METIRYHLKSDPEKFVEVPADYASKAESLVNLAVEHPAGLVAVLGEPYLANQGVLARTVSLTKMKAGTPESLKLQDEVYLRVCIYGVGQKMITSEREEAMELDSALIRMVQGL